MGGGGLRLQSVETATLLLIAEESIAVVYAVWYMLNSVGEYMQLDALLSRSGITKADLARRLGVTPNGVCKWKYRLPQYAVAYLELLIEYNRVRPWKK